MHKVPQYISTIQNTRLRHTMIIGQRGAGKSNLTSQLIHNDIEGDAGLFHTDLDGADTDTILRLIPKRRIKDVVLLDLSDTDYPVALNPFWKSGDNHPATIAEMFVEAFRSIWGYEDAATPDMDRTIYNAARVTLDYPNGTLLDMYHMLVDEQHRTKMVSFTKDEIVKAYWRNEFSGMDGREQRAVTKSTVNKLERFVADERIRKVFGQTRPLFDFRQAIEERKIILLKVPISTFGQNKAATIAGLMLAQFNTVARQRKGLLPFHLYLPDCEPLVGHTLSQMLATLGKRSVSITLSIQYLHQLGKLRPAIFGNIGNWYMFRVGLTDAMLLEELFEWDNTRRFLYELNQFEARIVVPHLTPVARFIHPLGRGKKPGHNAIIRHSRHLYARKYQR